jgi:hypothetical protein
MSPPTHTASPQVARRSSHGGIALSALLAVLALAVVVLVLSLGDAARTEATAGLSLPALRSDGGPEESRVAAALGARRAVRAPDESRIGAAIARAR